MSTAQMLQSSIDTSAVSFLSGEAKRDAVSKLQLFVLKSAEERVLHELDWYEVDDGENDNARELMILK